MEDIRQPGGLLGAGQVCGQNACAAHRSQLNRSSRNSGTCSTLAETRVCKEAHFGDGFQAVEQRQPVAL
jgi:hypothetical protein